MHWGSCSSSGISIIGGFISECQSHYWDAHTRIRPERHVKTQAPGSQELIYPSCQLAGEKRIWIIAIIDFQVVARTVVDRVEGDLEVKVDVRIAGL